MSIVTSLFFYQIFFHEYSRFTGQQEKEEAISLTFLYHIDLLQRYFDISWVINAESFCTQVATGFKLETFGFQAQVANH